MNTADQHNEFEATASGDRSDYILVADGNLDLSSQMKDLLQTALGIPVQCVCDGLAVIEKIRIHPPRLVLANVDLPRVDGFQLCRLINLPIAEGTDSIRVILTTAEYLDVVAEQVAHDVQAFAYLHTSAEPDTLIRISKVALGILQPDPLEPHLMNCRGNSLLVSTNDELLQIAVKAFEESETALHSKHSMDESWPLLDTGLVQCLILDSRLLHGNDGISIAGIRNDYRKLSIAIIADPGDAAHYIRWMEAGADNIILQPCSGMAVLKACREGLLQFNLRSVHEQIQEKIDKLRSVSDYLDMVIDYSQESIFSCDMNGTVKIWNKGAEKTYGYTAEEIIGRNVDKFLNPPDFKRNAGDVIRILSQRGSFAESEVMRRRKGGEEFPVAATYSSLLNSLGEFIGFSVVERDVTPVKALEAEKIKSARLRAITQTAVTANDHINTPLGVILGYSQFLKMKLADITESDTMALDTIQEQVHKIKGIMNKLKLMSDPIVKNYSIEGVTMFDLSKSK
ncbi:PAS domain S-box protein [bacterium]|nr:PAS domain S-box protein [bacterium]MBU1637103.1 PAS domain S-box protein [bacterium]MBU1919405.1 PAS domain S-box protein [bacterium]